MQQPTNEVTFIRTFHQNNREMEMHRPHVSERLGRALSERSERSEEQDLANRELPNLSAQTFIRTFNQNNGEMEIDRPHVSERLGRALSEEQDLPNRELEEIKEKLYRQKNLKEMYIHKWQDTKRELEMLKKYSTEDTLSKHRIAQRVRDTNRQKKKKQLHADYEELQVAHLVGTEKQTAELNTEINKNMVLQEELQKMTALYQELNLKYDTEIQTSKQQAEAFQHKLEQQSQAHAERESQNQQVILTLRAEQDILRQKKTEEIFALQQTAFEKEQMYLTELGGLKTQLNIQEISMKDCEELRVAQEEKFKAELKEEKNTSRLLRNELLSCKTANQELSEKYEALKQQAENQEQKLQTDIKYLHNTVADNQLKIWNLNTDKCVLQQKATEEINALQQTNMEKESSYCRELEGLRSQCALLVSQNTELSSELQARMEAVMPPKSPEETPDQQECMELITNEKEETAGPSGPGDAANEAEKPPSVWKRLLRSKKPQKCKKK